ncbi:MAG: prolipoprotein diacylglyceryl transferase [Bacteroidota bacterium]
MLNYIIWDIDPVIFSIGSISIRWYGLMFALGFLISHRVLSYIFKKEGKPESDVDTLTIYMVSATVIGARLGHFLFYEWESLMESPLSWAKDLIIPPYAGLASHGAAIGIFVALFLYARTKKDQSYLWIIDRMVIVVALTGCCIRLGNLMNSEIIGTATTVPWAFVFKQVDDVPRHPAQLYEAIYCIFLLAFLFWLWKQKKGQTREGLLSGLFMVMLFTLRFLDEFLKENQETFEDKLTLNMGQILSIPAILFGFLLLWIAYRKKQAPQPITKT